MDSRDYGPEIVYLIACIPGKSRVRVFHTLGKANGLSLRVHVHAGVAGDGGYVSNSVGPALDHHLARLVAAGSSGRVVQATVPVEERRFDRLAFERPLGQLNTPLAAADLCPFDQAAATVLFLNRAHARLLRQAIADHSGSVTRLDRSGVASGAAEGPSRPAYHMHLHMSEHNTRYRTNPWPHGKGDIGVRTCDALTYLYLYIITLVLVETLPAHRHGKNDSHGHSWPEGGLQIISLICDTRYLRHPRLSDGSRGGVRIVEGPRRGPKRFPLHIWPDTPSSRELVASTAPPGSQDPRSWITL